VFIKMVPRPKEPWLLRAEKWVPGIRAARTYQRAWAGKDIVAGIVLCALLVPQGMAYAELAGLPAITGLYTTVICLFAYAAFGPSPFLVLGPDSSLGPMIAAAILPLAAGDPDRAVVLAGMLALCVGIVCVGAGVTRLGFVADLLSAPIRVGYLSGLAVTIFVGQLPKLFGYSTKSDRFIEEIFVFLRGLKQTNHYA
jgi:MFS superfamily sulfate permease-like transporter